MAMYRRANLVWSDQRQLERQQFNNVDADEREWQIGVEKYWRRLLRDFGEGDAIALMNGICINKFHVKLKHKDVAQLFMERIGTGPLNSIRYNISPEAAQTYIGCICRYINRRRRPPINRNRPVGTSARPRKKSRSRSPVSGRPKFGYRESEAVEPDADRQPGPSCVMVPTDDFDRICFMDTERDAAIVQLLEDLDIDGPNFMDTDYIFMPQGAGSNHHYLVGIAPKQNFAFIMDSCFRFLSADNVTEVLREFIRIGTGNELSSQAWPVYGEWSIRTDLTKDGSPDVPVQRDSHNCGMFTVTNAFNLAFGYDLLCYGQEDLDDLKRQRMCAELANGGLGGMKKYHYPLLDLPGSAYTLFDLKLQASNYYKDRNLPQPLGTLPTRLGSWIGHQSLDPDPMDLSSPDDFEQRGFVPGSHIKKRDRVVVFPFVKKLATPREFTEKEFDDFTVKVFDYKPCEYSESKPRLAPGDDSDEPRDEDSSDSSDEADSDEDNAGDTRRITTSNELYVRARKLLDGPDSLEKTAYLKLLTAVDDHPWPPQFSKRLHRKAGLIYPIVKLPLGLGITAPSTRKNLRDACRNFPLKRVNEMMFLSRETARDWAETEMSAFMARALDEVKTKPFPGMARGYTKHKGSLDTSLAASLAGV